MERFKNRTGTAVLNRRDFYQAFAAHAQTAAVKELVHSLIDFALMVQNRLPQVGSITDLDYFCFSRFRILESNLWHDGSISLNLSVWRDPEDVIMQQRR